MSRPHLRLAHALGVVTALAAPALHAQRPEYRSPAGVVYSSQPDTGPFARARAASDAEPRNVALLVGLLRARPDSLTTAVAYARRLRLYRGEVGPDSVLTQRDTFGFIAAEAELRRLTRAPGAGGR